MDEITLRTIVRDECGHALKDHIAACPLMVTQVEPRVRSLESRLATLVGLAVGSGMLGGAGGALATKLLS